MPKAYTAMMVLHARKKMVLTLLNILVHVPIDVESERVSFQRATHRGVTPHLVTT